MTKRAASTLEPERISLLVVDDDETNRFALVNRLHRMGFHHVEIAGDGQHAFDLMMLHAFDLVFLDIMMPGLDGLQVLEKIKSEPQLRDVPVIIISALDDIDSIVTAIQLGAEDYLAKPFNPILLRARVTASLEKKLQRDRTRAETTRRWSAILDALSDGVLLIDEVGLIEAANTGACRLLERERSALIGMDIERLLPGALDALRDCQPGTMVPIHAARPDGPGGVVDLLAGAAAAATADGTAIIISLRPPAA